MRVTRLASLACLAGLLLTPALPSAAHAALPASPISIQLPADDVTVTPDPNDAAGPQAQTTDSGEQEATQEPTPEVIVAPTLTATGPGKAGNGEVVQLTGKLTQEDSPMSGRGITVSDRFGVVSESFTLTESDGTFATRYAVPEDQSDGTLSLTISSETTPQASTTVSLSIKHTELTTAAPSASEDEAEEEAEPAEAESAEATSETAAVAAEEPAQDETPSRQGVGIWAWFVGVPVGVGAIAAVSTAFLVYRDRKARAADEAESFALLGEHPDDHEADHTVAAQDDLETTARPSRGLPPADDDPQPPVAGRRGL